jgi:FeS assembly protein SufD
VFVGENAGVDHYKVQQESLDAFHIASLHVHTSRSSRFASHSFALGGKFVRNDATALLDGEGGDCTLNGLYLADRDRLIDNHTTIDHAKPHNGSHEVYKGILGGTARAVFNGKIIVRQDAQKTDAKQTNRALLLTDGATINTKPQLEIFADDVKCTHGAAIGQLDDEAIFYLRARGLPYAEARDMLIHAFAAQVLDGVQIEPLRAALEITLFDQLAKDLAEVDGAGNDLRDRARRSFDVQRVRADFPILSRTVNGRPLVYLDNAATTQKPRPCSTRSRRTTPASTPTCTAASRAEPAGDRRLRGGARSVRRLLQRRLDPRGRLHRNATEGINLVAFTFVKAGCRPGDEVLISAMEHHSNIVPWQLVCEAAGAHLRVAPIDDRGELLDGGFERLLTPRTKIAAITHMSNALGHDHAGARDRPARPRERRSRADRRVAGRRTTCAWTCRRSTAISSSRPGTSCTDRRHRRALRQGAHLEAMPPFHGRRRHDQLGHVREEHLERPALQVRGGHADIAGAIAAARGARLHRRDAASTRSRRTSATCSSTARGVLRGDRRHAAHRDRRAEGQHPRRS